MTGEIQPPVAAAPQAEQGGQYDHLFAGVQKGPDGFIQYEPVDPATVNRGVQAPQGSSYLQEIQQKTANRQAAEAIRSGDVSEKTKRALSNVAGLYNGSRRRP